LLQRRRGERVDCDLAARYYRDLSLEEMERLSAGVGEAARIRDISIGGVKMLTDRLLVANQRLGLKIALEPGEPVIVGSSVVRGMLVETRDVLQDGQRFSVAIQFRRMSRIHQVQLQRFLIKCSDNRSVDRLAKE